MLNEKTLFTILKNNFDNVIDKIDENIYDILPCYTKKKLVLKITKEELLEGISYEDDDDYVINISKQLKPNKKYCIKFLNEDFFMYYDSEHNNYYYEDDFGLIGIGLNMYLDNNSNIVEDKNYIMIGLSGCKYTDIKTDLEIYEIIKLKKLDTELMPESIYLENEDGYVIISPDEIYLDGLLNATARDPYLYVNKPISFSSTIYDNSDENILVNKKYVDSKTVKDYTLREVFSTIISTSSIDNFLSNSFMSRSTWIMKNAHVDTLAYEYMDYYLQINQGRTYKLYHSYRKDSEYLNDSMVIYIDKEKDLKLYVSIIGSEEGVKLILDKNKTTNFNCTCESIFHTTGSSFILNLYEIDKNIKIKDGFYLPLDTTISNSLQIGTNYDNFNGKIQGDRSLSVGERTVARGVNSAAIGMCVESNSTGQFAFGMYNKIDNDNKYILVAGNGIEEGSRSNAHTLDWKGNAWYAGKLSQEKTPTEDKDLTTKKYVDNTITEQITSSQATDEEVDTMLQAVLGGDYSNEQ